jgi:moderate conductance mechanosensitive channel
MMYTNSVPHVLLLDRISALSALRRSGPAPGISFLIHSNRREIVMRLRVFLRLVMIPALVFLIFFPSAAGALNMEEVSQVENEASGEKPIEPGGLGGRLLAVASERMQRATEKLSEAGQGFLAVPVFLKELLLKSQDPRTLARWGQMAGKILLVLFAALLAEWLIRRLLGRLRRSIEDQQIESFPLRILLILAHTVLDIIPIAVFAFAAYGALPLTDPGYETRLIALTLVNATVLARVILALARMVLVPRLPALRLFALGDETTHYLYIWIRRIVDLGVYGYFILEAGLLLGMPGGLYVFLMKFLGLTIAAMLVVLVKQNKNEVAGWLRGDRLSSDEEQEKEDERLEAARKTPRPRFQALGALRRRFADFWHVVAKVLIVGFFLIWALEIEGGMTFLLSGLVMTVVVIILARLLLRLVHHGVDRLFNISEELKTAYPDLEGRANRYKPFLRKILKVVVYVIAAFSILEVWGLGTLGWLFSPMGGVIVGELVTLGLIIAGIFLLWEIVGAMIERSLTREAEKEKGSMRKLTLLPLLRNVVRITLVVMGSMLVLSQLGINIGPLLAGAGIIGLAVGFGAQTLVRDMITGAFILVEDAVSVGDWVQAGGHSGTVERLTIRTVTLRDLAGAVHVVPFGDVTTVTNFNRDYGYALIDAGVAYRERYDEVVQALEDVALELKRDDTWGPSIIGDLEVFGLNNLGDSAVEIRVRLKTLPMRQFGVRRAFLEKMKRVFDERRIEIPFPHRTIWFGTDKDGTAPPLHLAREDRKALESPGRKPDVGFVVQAAPESGASQTSK